MNAAFLIGAVAIIAVGATWLVRHYALRNSLLDVPNERSSHTRPTPRGGGIGIIAGLIIGLCIAFALSWADGRLVVALLAGCVLVGGIGLVDDHRHVPARVRASVHFIAAIIALVLVGGLPSLRFGTAELALGVTGWTLGVLGIVWSINLYNFMDGIDGIAGAETIMVCGAGALLALLTGATTISIASALVAASAVGFLVWNWPPARIFMGDVGSGLLGYCIAVIAIASENTGGPALVVWLVLGAVFFFDATVTLVRRVLRGEKWFEAHRRHAYQRAVQAGWSHATVTGTVIVLNVVLVTAAFGIVLGSPWAPMFLFGAAALILAIYVAIERVYPMYRG